MRRRTTYLTAALILSLLAALRFLPEAKRWWPSGKQLVVPVNPPGTLTIEGPYFSDVDRVADRIIAALNRTQQSLDVAIYDLTEPNIAAAIEAAHRRGVHVRVAADHGQTERPRSEIPYLAARGIPVRLSRGYRGNRSLMHNKFAVFDGKLAVTGSFNWTTSAGGYNFENIVFISDPSVVSRFQQAFERIWSQACRTPQVPARP